MAPFAPYKHLQEQTGHADNEFGMDFKRSETSSIADLIRLRANL